MQYLTKLSLFSCLFMSFSNLAIAKNAVRDQHYYTDAGYVSDEVCLERSRWWINVGLGGGGTLSKPAQAGLAGQFSFNGTFTPHTVLTVYSNALVTSDNDNGSYPHDESLKAIGDIGILLGYVNRKPQGFWSVSTGIAYQEVEKHIPTNGYWGWYNFTEITKSAALPIQAQAFWTPVRHFGIGIIGHGIVVPNPYVTALLAIQIS
jgi:hypothetical protein